MSRLNIKELLDNFGMAEAFYWGKRIVKPLPQPGSFKNHAVVANWVEPRRIRLELKAGLSGRTLPDKELANYPLQFQSDTFFELEVQDEDGDGKEGKGKSGGSTGGKGLKSRFVEADHEEIPTHARLSRGVVMGMEIAKDALNNVFSLFQDQVKAAKIVASDLLAAAGKAITRYTPPAFMAPRGDENKVYTYDRAKNEALFGIIPS